MKSDLLVFFIFFSGVVVGSSICLLMHYLGLDQTKNKTDHKVIIKKEIPTVTINKKLSPGVTVNTDEKWLRRKIWEEQNG